MRNSIFYPIRFTFLFGFLFIACQSEQKANDISNPKDPIVFSQQFLLSQKSGKQTSAFIDTLQSLDAKKLSQQLTSDSEKKAFWINCYNALVQYNLEKDSTSFLNRDSFFNKRNTKIGGKIISLNDIENGVLRLKKVKFQEDFIASFRPKQLDYRIHFALNCGATSCPPIAYYDPKDLDKQLSIAELSFISTNTSYDAAKNEVAISELFKWFADDFGGESGVLKLLKTNQVIPPWSNPKIIYTAYDWNLSVKKFN